MIEARALRTSRVVGATGYLHPGYAEALGEFGTPQELSGSRGWLLRRRIPGSDEHDAMGCYPLFSCRDWSRLSDDVEGLAGRLVSMSMVTDPFGDYDESYLVECFKDRVIPFKEHFVVDLSRSPRDFVCDHHRRYAKRALGDVHVEVCRRPVEFAEEWIKLYAVLIEKHGIKGMAAFSRTALAAQLAVPGTVMFRAVHEADTAGITLWYTQGEVGYYHLGAYSVQGYELRAAFALFWTAIEHFAATGLRWLNLGAGAGVKASKDDGLTRFKRGWSTGTRTAYFCGRILDRQKYSGIVKTHAIQDANYFPAYRAGEFG